MSISSKVKGLEDSKAAIKTVLEAKGLEVGNVTIDHYADIMADLPVLPNKWGTLTFVDMSTFTLNNLTIDIYAGSLTNYRVTDPAAFAGTLAANGADPMSINHVNFDNYGWGSWEVMAESTQTGSMITFQIYSENLTEMGVEYDGSYDYGQTQGVSFEYTPSIGGNKTINLTEALVTTASYLCFTSENQRTTLPTPEGNITISCSDIVSCELKENATTVQNNFLAYTTKMTSITGVENLVTVGDDFLYNSAVTGNFTFTKLTSIGTSFMYNTTPSIVSLPLVQTIPNNFLNVQYGAKDTTSIALSIPSATTIGSNFLKARMRFNQDLDLSNVTSINALGFMYSCSGFNGTMTFGVNTAFTFPASWNMMNGMFGYCNADSSRTQWPTFIFRQNISTSTGTNFADYCFTGQPGAVPVKYKPIFKGAGRASWMSALPNNTARQITDGGDE